MVFSYIGETYPAGSRPQVVGTLAALRTVSYLVMVQLIGYVVVGWGWRQAFLFLVAPMTVVGFLLSQRTLPRVRSKTTTSRANVQGRAMSRCLKERLEPRAGIEPATNSLQGCRSTTELPRHAPCKAGDTK
jgi:MFS family permease